MKIATIKILKLNLHTKNIDNMYQLDTDLSKYYGEGKGFAKSIDLSTFQNAQQTNALNEAKQQAQEDKKIAEIYKQIDDAPAVLNPRDAEYVGNQMKEFYEKAYSNIDKLNNGDPAAMSEFLKDKYERVGEIERFNQGYKNVLKTRALVNQKGGEGAFYKSSIDPKVFNVETEGDIGDYNIKTPIALPKTSNNEYFLNQGLKLKQQADLDGRKSSTSDKEAANFISNELHADEKRYFGEAEQAVDGNEMSLPEDVLNKMTVYKDYDSSGKGVAPLKLSRDPEKLNMVDGNGNRMYIEPTAELVAQGKYRNHLAGNWIKPKAGAMTEYQLAKLKEAGDGVTLGGGGGLNTKSFALVPFTETETETVNDNWYSGDGTDTKTQRQSYRIVSNPESENKTIDIISNGRAYSAKPLIVDRYPSGEVKLRASVDGRVMEFPIDKDLRANLKGHLSTDPIGAAEIMYGKTSAKKASAEMPKKELTWAEKQKLKKK